MYMIVPTAAPGGDQGCGEGSQDAMVAAHDLDQRPPLDCV
jgi:hypothetical protein